MADLPRGNLSFKHQLEVVRSEVSEYRAHGPSMCCIEYGHSTLVIANEEVHRLESAR